MKLSKQFIVICTFLLSHLTAAQTTFLDSISNPNYIAWEYQLDEIVIGTEEEDVHSLSFRYYKNDPLNSNDQVMEKLSGVWGMKRGNYAYEPVMRGLSGGQINITIDEMRILGACTDKMDPITSYVEPNNLEKINISQGANGFQSGSTIGGNFDMQIKKPEFGPTEGWNSIVAMSYSFADQGFRSLFNSSYNSKKFGARFSGAYRKAGDYQAGGGEIIEYSSYSKTNFSLSASYQSGSDALINLSWIGDYAWDIGYPALPMDVATARANVISLTFEKGNLSQRWSELVMKGYYNRIDHVMDDSNRDVMVRMDMPGFTNTSGAFIKGSYLLGEKISGKMKVDGYSSIAHAEMTMYFSDAPPMYMLTWPDIRRNVLGYQNQTTIILDQKMTLSGGFRVEGNSVSMKSDLGERQVSVFQFGAINKGEFLFNANIAFDLMLGENLIFGLRANYGERMPTESEQFGFYLFNAYDGYDYIGRPDLGCENSGQIEASLNFEKENFKALITGFYYNIDSYILGITDPDLSPMTIGANGVKVYRNMKFARISGVESQLSYSIGRLSLLDNAKFTYGETIDNLPVPLIPPLKNNLEISFQTKSSWAFNIGIETALRQDRINTYFGETATPGYTISNVLIGKTFNLQNSTINFLIKAENIFDAYYYEHLDWGQIPRIGRNFTISTSIRF